MTLTFVRHAEAVNGSSDIERKLTERGEQQAIQLATFFASIEYPPQLIFSSPMTRAQQTAEAIKQRVKTASLLEQTWLACGMSPEICLSKVQAVLHFGYVLLVGHEPDLSTTIAFLLGCQSSENLQLQKAGICALEVDPLCPGRAIMQYFLPFDVLCLLHM